MTTFHMMSLLTTNDLHRIFETLDKNGDKLVSLEELNWLLERIGVQLSLHELEALVGKTSLNFNEFLFFYESISTSPHKHNKDDVGGSGGDDHEDSINEEDDEEDEDEDESDLAKAFNVFDINGDGFISCEELESVLRRLGVLEENSSRDCRNMIHVFDTNLDGLLDFQEFKTMMLQTTIS